MLQERGFLGRRIIRALFGNSVARILTPVATGLWEKITGSNGWLDLFVITAEGRDKPTGLLAEIPI
jgi:hypothetical protein